MSSAFNIPAGWREVIESLVRHIEVTECQHEDTYRGGAIWTICRDCDRKWADDRGGYKPYVRPAVLLAADKLLSAAPTPPVDAVPGEPVAYLCVRAGEADARLPCTKHCGDHSCLAASVASRAGSEPVAIPERNALLRLLVAEVTRLQTLFTDALGDTQQDSAPIAPAAAAEPSERSEQSAFEDWLELTCPSGDVESVQRQWLSSSAHEDWYDEQCNAATPVPPDRERAASLVASEGMVLVPRELLQAASKSLGSFVSEEGWTQQDMDVMDSIDAALAARSSAGEAQS